MCSFLYFDKNYVQVEYCTLLIWTLLRIIIITSLDLM